MRVSAPTSLTDVGVQGVSGPEQSPILEYHQPRIQPAVAVGPDDPRPWNLEGSRRNVCEPFFQAHGRSVEHRGLDRREPASHGRRKQQYGRETETDRQSAQSDSI
jgi:hypothetical protein